MPTENPLQVNAPKNQDISAYERIQTMLNMFYLSIINGLEKEIIRLKSELLAEKLAPDEQEALKDYRYKRDLPTSAAYEIRTWDEDSLCIKFKGRTNIAQFSKLTSFCTSELSNVQILSIKYKDEHGKIHHFENPTAEQINTFKRSSETEYINDTHMTIIREVEVAMKPVCPEYIKDKSKKEFFDMTARRLSSALAD